MALIHEGSQIRIFRSLGNSAQSGLSVLRALEIIRGMQPRVLGALASDVRAGGGLAAAMRRQAWYFPSWQSDLVEVGETTGRLDAAFANIAEILEQRRAFALSLVVGLLYPLAILHAAPLFFCGSAVAKLFTCGMAGLPGALVEIAGCVLKFLLPFYLAVAAAAWAWFSWLKDSPLASRLPLLGIATKMRFCLGLASLLKAAVPLDKALSLAAASSGLAPQAGLGEEGAGRGVVERLRPLDLFSLDELAQLDVAEQTGNISSELSRIAEAARQTWQAALKAVGVMLPPVVYLVILLVIAYKIVGVWTGHFAELDSFMK